MEGWGEPLKAARPTSVLYVSALEDHRQIEPIETDFDSSHA